MPHMIVRPRVDEWPTNGFDALRGVDPDKIVHLTGLIEVGSLTGGMTSGKPSVAFVFALPDGRVVVAETSLDLFTTAAHGLRAAHENRGPDAEPVPTRPCDSPRGEPCRTPR